MRVSTLVILSSMAASSAAMAQSTDGLPQPSSVEPPVMGVAYARGHQSLADFMAAAGNVDTSQLMTYHGGKIMPKVISKAIFWGAPWNNAAFAGDKITGLDSWYAGHGGSNYAATVNEYTGSNGKVGSKGFIHQGHIIDPSAAKGGGSTSVILAEVCKEVTAGNIVPNANGYGYYPVYSTIKRGNAGYCAWHSSGSCSYNGQQVPIQFAFFFSMDSDPGCDPQDNETGHSVGLASLANVTGHELSEARSDPSYPPAWYDASGMENGDKCAWTFNVPYVTFTNNTMWKVQGEWSNAAFRNSAGYNDGSGHLGCLDGH